MATTDPKPKTMQALTFHAPYKVHLESVPIPRLRDPGDVIVKVHFAAVCGSDLHVYRGIEKVDQQGMIMGHEFTGEVVERGADVKSVEVGDLVVAPFTTSCGQCFYCTSSLSSRCTHSLLFGSPALPGAQAEYVRVPFADGTLLRAPSTIQPRNLLLMADIFPTGFYGANSAFKLSGLSPEQFRNATAVVIGCGPVGLCAVVAMKKLGPRRIFAVDRVKSRLELARGLGAEPLDSSPEAGGDAEVLRRIKDVTEGRGADVVVEVVGLSPALRTGFEVLRPFGAVVSIGVHNAEIPYTGAEAYDKNLKIQMGRCPVRSIFPEALELLQEKQDLFGFMFENIIPLSEGVKGYEVFNSMKVQKVVFEVSKPDADKTKESK